MLKKVRFLGNNNNTFWVGLILLIATLALFWPATGYHFVVMDDDTYVYDNPWLRPGLDLASIKWAFTTIYAANWHPLTWLSLMLDYTMFGPFAGGYHLTNIILHSVNTLLLFLTLKRLTQALWPSALVAALFGWHPLHVESVAWVAERKDVLCTFFLFFTLWTYCRYVERPTLPRYLSALVLFALALMSKSMAVTLPCLLLLLDYWPLNRMPSKLALPRGDQQRTVLARLLVEKLPFFGLSCVVSVLTVIAQNSGGAIKSIQQVPFALRIFNALVAYTRYVSDTIWPVNLCVYYPLPSHIPVLQVICALLVLVAISWLAFKTCRQFPWLIVGWLWFLGTLVPVIGLVQVGKQAMADRYTYIPDIGLFIMVAWSILYWIRSRPTSKTMAVAGAAVVLCACMVATRAQLAYWRNSITLFTRADSLTQNNAVAENNLGVALSRSGRGHEAISYFQAVLSTEPNDVQAHYNLGIELASEGKPVQAEFQFVQALKYDPESEKLHNNLGVVFAQQGKLDSAISEFKKAIQLNPIYPNPYLDLGMVFQEQGKAGAAIANYRRALALAPNWSQALDKLAFLTAACRGTRWYNPSDAVVLAKRANDLTDYKVPSYLETLALSYAATGDFTNAATITEMVKSNTPPSSFTKQARKLDEDLELYRRGTMPQTSWTNFLIFGVKR